MNELTDSDFKAVMAVMQNRLGNIEASMAAINTSLQSLAGSQHHFVTSVETRLAVGSERFSNITRKIDEQTAALAGKANADDLKELKSQIMSKRTAGTIAGGVSATVTFLVEILKGLLNTGAGNGR
jgi:hypothetical protein